MAYGVICTFDLKGASSKDYENAYAKLAALDLYRVQANDSGGKTVIPTTTVLGSYIGSSADAVRDRVRTNVKAAFTALGLKSEIFVVVGGEDWTWGATTS